MPKVISYLIDHCPDLFGESVLTLLGPELELPPLRPDSGAEVSDSSCNSLPDSTTSTTATAINQQSNLTDISSAESDRKNKTSLSNLSRDSGLTASDTQLYSPADAEDHDDDGPEEEKMFSLPAATSLPAVLFNKSPLLSRNKNNKILNNNTSLINNNSHKCVNRVLSTSIPHLNTDELESMLNGTFSYGKSVGIGLNGSCQDVVRNRKRHQVLASTPIPPQVLTYDGNAGSGGRVQHTTPLSSRGTCRSVRSPLVSMENQRLPSAPSVNNLYNYQHHTHQLQHLHQHHQHHHHHQHHEQQQQPLHHTVNRFFSKSVPHLNLIGFRNSVTFSPSPRRATRVNLHAWSYDVSDPAQHSPHNQSLPNQEYQSLMSSPAAQQQQQQREKCMFRCRATPFIPYGSQQSASLTPCYARTNGLTSGQSGSSSGGVTVNGKRLQAMSHCMSSSPSCQQSCSTTSGKKTTSTSLSPFGSVCPPSYQETMDRKKFAARLQSNVSLFRKISFDGVYEQFELRL